MIKEGDRLDRGVGGASSHAKYVLQYNIHMHLRSPTSAALLLLAIASFSHAYVIGNEGIWGVWSSVARCKPGEYICGMRVRCESSYIL